MNIRNVAVEGIQFIFSYLPNGFEFAIIALLILVTIFLTVKKYWKSFPTKSLFLVSMRLFIVFAMLFVFMKPEVEVNLKYRLKENLLLLIDGSSSMNLPVESGKTQSRYQYVKKLVDRYIDRKLGN